MATAEKVVPVSVIKALARAIERRGDEEVTDDALSEYQRAKCNAYKDAAQAIAITAETLGVPANAIRSERDG